MSPKGGVDVLTPEGEAAPLAVLGILDAVPSRGGSENASPRGGRIDFATATDLVDEASQESFPASDPPAWSFRDDHPDEPRRP